MLQPTPRLVDVLYWLSSATLVLLPLAVAAAAVLAGFSTDHVARAFPDIAVSADLPRTRAVLALLVGLAPGLAVLWTLWQVRALFALYRGGHDLSPDAALRIGRIGSGLLLAAAIGIAVRPLQVLILTSANPPGERVLAVSFSSADLGFLLAGGLMLAIGRVMAEAARIADDNARII